MAIDFPNSPSVGQIYTVGSRSWKWDGTIWATYANNPVLYRQDTAPSSPQDGDQWFETDTGRWFVYYDSVWVEIGNATDIAGVIQPKQITDLTAVTSLTSDDVFAVVDNPSSAVAANKITLENLAPALMQSAPQTMFRNAYINGDFRINQRGWSSSTATGTYGFDRWKQVNNGGIVTMSSQSFTVGSPVATGYEAEKFCRLVTASQISSGDYALLVQQIEDVRSFANATVTVSFWAKCSSLAFGAPKVALEMQQVFGSGGSADVNTYGGQATLSTSWARYSLTVTVPSISGKTIGTSSNLGVQFWVSGGSTFNSRTGSLGIQNNTFDFWGMQVERGSYATPFEQRPIGTELALCQRYYWNAGTVWNNWISANPNQFGEAFIYKFPVTMRATPTISYTFTNNDNGQTLSMGATKELLDHRVTCVNTGFQYLNFTLSFAVNIEF